MPRVTVSKWQSQDSNPGRPLSELLFDIPCVDQGDLASICEPRIVSATQTASLEGTCLKIRDALHHPGLQDDHMGITSPILMMEKLRFKSNCQRRQSQDRNLFRLN